MKSRVLPVCIALCLAGLAALQAQRGPAAPVTAIVGARLIDGTGSGPIDNAVVIVNGDRITAAGARSRVMRAGRWVD